MNSITHPIRPAWLVQLSAAVSLTLSASTAFAHIDVDMGGTHKSRVSGGYDIKDAPCGMADAKRGTNVYKYRPGATVTIKVYENIAHPSYFRISFDNDGTDNFVIPSGTAGEHGNCGGNPNCGPGKEDFCTNDTVLLDNLDLHPSGGAKTYTWSVTLPNVECTNCTLQIIQMMNDFAPFHSPAEYPADDIYYHCIDIELSKDAPESLTMPAANNGINCKDGKTGTAGAPAAAGAGGSVGSAGAAGSRTAGTGGTVAAIGGNGAVATSGTGGTAPASAGTAGAVNRPISSPVPSGGAPATGSSSSPQGAAGSGTSTSTPQGIAGSSTSTSGGSAGTASPSPAPTSTESGGCQAASGNAGGWFAPAILCLITLGFRSYRRRQTAWRA